MNRGRSRHRIDRRVDQKGSPWGGKKPQEDRRRNQGAHRLPRIGGLEMGSSLDLDGPAIPNWSGSSMP